MFLPVAHQPPQLVSVGFFSCCPAKRASPYKNDPVKKQSSCVKSHLLYRLSVLIYLNPPLRSLFVLTSFNGKKTFVCTCFWNSFESWRMMCSWEVRHNGPLFLNHHLNSGYKRLESKAEIEKASRKGFIASSIPTDTLFNNLHLNNLLWQYYNKCAGGGIDRSASLFLHSYTPSEQRRGFCKLQVLTNFSLNGFISTKNTAVGDVIILFCHI